MRCVIIQGICAVCAKRKSEIPNNCFSLLGRPNQLFISKRKTTNGYARNQTTMGIKLRILNCLGETSDSKTKRGKNRKEERHTADPIWSGAIWTRLSRANFRIYFNRVSSMIHEFPLGSIYSCRHNDGNHRPKQNMDNCLGCNIAVRATGKKAAI